MTTPSSPPDPQPVDGQPAIWVVGSTMVDMIAYAARIPQAGETLVGDRFALGFGGKGANQAVMAARLGAHVTMVNAVGGDAFGEMTIANLRAEGIDVGHMVLLADESTGAAPIWVEPDGTNRILIIPGANERMDPDAAADAVAGAAVLDVVVGQLEIPQRVTEAAFRAARIRGATTILNPAPAADLDPALLAVTDWLVPNEVEFAHLASALGVPADDPSDPATVVAVAAAAGTGLVVTLGAAGAIAVDSRGTILRLPAPAVEAADTTGAGDAFVGGFAYAIGRHADLASALAVACSLASDSVRRPGTQRSFPTSADANRIAGEAGLLPTPPDHLPH